MPKEEDHVNSSSPSFRYSSLSSDHTAAQASDSGRLNRAAERVAAGGDSLVEKTVASLDGLRFPAYKQQILDHAKRRTGDDPDVVALLETLDGYTVYNDVAQVRRMVSAHGSEGKLQRQQMTDAARVEPNVRTRPTSSDRSIKDREAVNAREERSDYPEVTPTAMSNFVCSRCGKPFQNQDDLARHQEFESGWKYEKYSRG